MWSIVKNIKISKKKKYIKKIKFIVLDYKDSCIINSFVLFVTVNLLVKNLGRIVLFDLFFFKLYWFELGFRFYMDWQLYSS